MAMRCWYSKSIVPVLALVACVTTTTRLFLPSPQNPIYRPAQAGPVLAEYLRLQCPAFRKAGKPDSGVVRFVVSLDSAGFARQAELRNGSGDQLVDEVFGTVAAQLSLADSSGPRVRPRQQPVEMRFQCMGDSARVVVLQAGS
jgi:hypothetical protein